MILSFKHRGLKALYEGQRVKKIRPAHRSKLLRILSALDEATHAREMDLPSFGLHALKGKLKGNDVMSVSGNWRVIFRFEGEHAVDVNYVDYH